jgi:ATP-binding cassette subfamily F protein uup
MPARRQPSRKLSYNEQRELERLPATIETLEIEVANLKSESESPDFYKAGGDHIRRVLDRIETAANELELAIARWLELDERSVL